MLTECNEMPLRDELYQYTLHSIILKTSCHPDHVRSLSFGGPEMASEVLEMHFMLTLVSTCKNSIARASIVVFNCLQNPVDADSTEHIQTHAYIPMNYAAHCCWPLLSLDLSTLPFD
jgi:hypothetical protein